MADYQSKFTGAEIDEKLEKAVLGVQLNGTSIVENGVANIPIAGINGKLGLLFVDANSGTSIAANGRLYVVKATESQIKAKGDTNQVIAPQYIQFAVKAGLIPKERYTTEEYNNLLTTSNSWTPEEQTAAQQTLGISSGTQLYKHHIVAQTGETTRYIVDIVSPRSTEYDFGTLVEDINNYPGFTRMYYQEYMYQEYIGGNDWRVTGIHFMFEGQMMYGVDTATGALQLGYIMEFNTIEEYTPIPL